MKLIPIMAVLCLAVPLALFAACGGFSQAAGADATVVEDKDSVADLKSAIENANADSRFVLTDAFAADMLASGVAIVDASIDVDVVIDGSGVADLVAKTGHAHFDVHNGGTGKITFSGLTLTGGGAAYTGGIVLRGGDYAFVDCKISGLKKTAVDMTGSDNSTYFKNCTFDGNSSRAIFVSSGSPAYKARHVVEYCYFYNNSLSNSAANRHAQGGAIGNSGSLGNAEVQISHSVFNNNKVIGTLTGSGENNNVDGGAVALVNDSADVTEVKIWDCYFEDNFAQDDGGAILILGRYNAVCMKSSIWNCTFIGNTAAGAYYFRSMGLITYGLTNGSGGAISYYGLTESEIAHCTFYNNGITGTPLPGNPGTNVGNVGGGGAIGVDTDDSVTDPANLPPCPVLSNNIFVGNFVKKNIYYMDSALKNTIESMTNGKLNLTPYTGNVFVMTGADSDRQNPATIERPFTNNGNIGYDNGNDRYNYENRNSVSFLSYVLTRFQDDLGTCDTDGITVANVFAELSGGVPVKKTCVDGAAGRADTRAERQCLVPSPTSDELYRDGSGPYYVANVGRDTNGFTRDHYPSAGAVEIYWTKFVPDSAASGQFGLWSSVVPTAIPNPSDPSNPYLVIKSLNFASNNAYYIITSTGLPGSPSGNIVAMPRSALDHTDPGDYGFAGWRGSQPENPSDPATNWTYPLYQPGDSVTSVKQTLTGEWSRSGFRVDFDLNTGASDDFYRSQEPGREAPRTHVPRGSAIAAPLDPVRDGYVFLGWFSDRGATAPWDFAIDTVSADIVLYASWRVAPAISETGKTFTVTGGCDEGSAISPEGSVAVAEGGSARFEFSAKSGHYLSEVLIDGVPSQSAAAAGFYVFERVSGNHTIFVKSLPYGGAEDAPHMIIATCDPGATIDPYGAIRVAHGADARFSFGAKPGFSVIYVEVDGERIPHEQAMSGSYEFSNVSSNHDIRVATDYAAPAGSGGSGGKWSPINLICAILALAAGFLAAAFGGRRRGGSEKGSKASVALRALALAIGILSIAVFFATEDMSLAAAASDEWTLPMAALMAAAVAASLGSFSSGERRG
ncbi:MAG: InlB B-repeat-containing protein [Candidatus Methanoplasma sp.]|nr:InlB B-repeat-containing protein [Candidatus Methanoplasma sp.]